MDTQRFFELVQIALLLAALLFIGFGITEAKADGRLIVVGDSLTASSDSWPQLLDHPNVHCYCQGGRAIKKYDAPRDLWMSNKDTILYALGSNDVWQWDEVGTRLSLRNQLNTFSQGARLIIVLPPVQDRLKPHIGPMRKILVEEARARGLSIINLQQVWDASRTTDGLHPDASLSYDIARFIEDELYAKNATNAASH